MYPTQPQPLPLFVPPAIPPTHHSLPPPQPPVVVSVAQPLIPGTMAGAGLYTLPTSQPLLFPGQPLPGAASALAPPLPGAASSTSSASLQEMLLSMSNGSHQHHQHTLQNGVVLVDERIDEDEALSLLVMADMENSIISASAGAGGGAGDETAASTTSPTATATSIDTTAVSASISSIGGGITATDEEVRRRVEERKQQLQLVKQKQKALEAERAMVKRQISALNIQLGMPDVKL